MEAVAPYYTDDLVTVHHGDCLEVMAAMPDASVHAVVTDPPYGLEFMGKDWDNPARMVGQDNAAVGNGSNYFKRKGDAGYVPGNAAWYGRVDMRAFQSWCEQWAAECLRVLKPGGHLLAFGGSRTWHRLAVAIEDAGFEMRDSIAWLYGSGFPKSLDVSKAIDKAGRRDYVLAAIALGLEVPGNNLHDWTKAEHSPGDAWWTQFKAHLSPDDWQKLERAVVGSGTSGATAGMQNLGPSGIKGGGYDVTAPATPDAARWQGWGTALKPAFEPIVVARKPLTGTVAQTVLAHGTGALNVDGCRVEASADYHDLKVTQGGKAGGGFDVGSSDGTRHTTFTPAAGRWPPNAILDDAAAVELDRQSGDVGGGLRSGYDYDATNQVYGDLGRSRANPQNTYGDSGGASRFFPTFRYEAKAPTDERPRVNGVAHATVKPLDLMRWLVRLVTPPGGTILDPFAGSGTTAEAAVIEGFRCVTIEREADYLPLIVARLSKPLEPVLDLGALG